MNSAHWRPSRRERRSAYESVPPPMLGCDLILTWAVVSSSPLSTCQVKLFCQANVKCTYKIYKLTILVCEIIMQCWINIAGGKSVKFNEYIVPNYDTGLQIKNQSQLSGKGFQPMPVFDHMMVSEWSITIALIKIFLSCWWKSQI